MTISMGRTLGLALVLLALPATSLVLRSAKIAPIEMDHVEVCHPDIEFEISCPAITKMSGDSTSSLREKWWLPVPGADLIEHEMSKASAEVVMKKNTLLYDLAGSNQLRQRFQNKHIVLLGDSVSQYMYMNLAYNLLHKKVPDFDFTWWKMEQEFKQQAGQIVPRTKKNMTTPYTFKQMYTIWEQTSNTQLSTDEFQEVCDCWFESHEDSVQNRYLKLEDSAITFLPWHNAKTKFRFHWTPKEGYPMQTDCKISECHPPFKHEFTGDPEGAALFQTLEEVVLKLEPKPTHILMNKGLWGHMEQSKLKKLFEVGKKLREIHGTRFIWQSQTQRGYGLQNSKEFAAKHPEVEAMDFEKDKKITRSEVKLAKTYGWDVLDLWEHSKGLEGTRLDDMHYNEKAKTYLNSILVKQLFPQRSGAK